MSSFDSILSSDDVRVVDISYTVTPGKSPDRPFAVQRGTLPDGSYKYDVLETHSHVGTHVEGGAHFYGEEGDDPDVDTLKQDPDHRSIEEYPLESFYGPGVLFPITTQRVTVADCEEAIGGILAPGDIVIARNDTDAGISKDDKYTDDETAAPAFTPEAAEWLAEQGIKGMIIGEVQLGETIKTSNQFHDYLMSEGAVLVEIVDNLDAIEKERFDVMALPYKIERLGSSFCRAVVIEQL